ncbi:MAG: universal stress protein [Planctomycetota bacterium]|nr:universal stress protein [Planctomycetota bacterium]
MISTILVPLDGTKQSEKIIPHVHTLLKISDAEVTLLSVLEHEVDEDPVDWQDRNKYAKKNLERISEDLIGKGAKARFRILTGDPAEEIVLYADLHGPSLIAMTTHGRSGPVRWIRGSVAERVLRQSRVPILMVNPHTEEISVKSNHFKRILVPLDGSELAERALPLAKEFARAYDAELVLFHCEFVQEYPDVVVGRDHQQSQKILKPYYESLLREGFSVTTKTSFGLAADEILKAAVKEHVDLIALTTHGRMGFSRWLFGSTAEGVLRHCTCPVLVHRTAAFAVRKPEETWEEASVEERLGELSSHARIFK